MEYVSLAEVRLWKDGVTSEVLGMASSAAVLFNGRDICLGGLSGELSVLSSSGIE